MYAVLRLRKLKTINDIAMAGAHNTRKMQPINADPSRSIDILCGSSDLLSDVKPKLPAKRRKNAVLAVEFVLSASPEYFRPDAPEQAGTYDFKRYEDWETAAYGWLSEQFGDNLVSAITHKDEATPHIHAVLVPLDERNKLNCDKFFGTPEKLRKLQTSYANALRKLGIQRGETKSKTGASHQSIKKYYETLNKIESAGLIEEFRNFIAERKKSKLTFPRNKFRTHLP